MMKSAIHFGATCLLGFVLCACGSSDVPAVQPAPAPAEPDEPEEIEPAPEPEPPPPGLAPSSRRLRAISTGW